MERIEGSELKGAQCGRNQKDSDSRRCYGSPRGDSPSIISRTPPGAQPIVADRKPKCRYCTEGRHHREHVAQPLCSKERERKNPDDEHELQKEVVLIITAPEDLYETYCESD